MFFVSSISRDIWMTRPTTLESAGGVTAAREPLGLPLPATLGPWRLVRHVGGGPLTCVYRAGCVDCTGEQPPGYAVKVLRPQWEDDPRAVAMLRREAFVGCKVSHPRLISTLSAHVKQPPYYIVTPWLIGETLLERLRRRGSLAAPVALWVARQTAEALAALHAAGWLHGDVKPENIFLSPEGQVTLLDLAFATSKQEAGAVAERPVVGTLRYIAPEMLTSASPATAASDLYSLGVALYEMLAGRAPFECNDPAALAAGHRQQSPPELKDLVAADLTDGVYELIRSLLAKQPPRRPASAALVKRLIALEIETLDDRF